MNPPLLNSDPIGADEIVKVAPSQGKGLGLFTTRSVVPGQLLVKEKPLVKVSMALIFIMTFPMLLLSKQPSLNCLIPRPGDGAPRPKDPGEATGPAEAGSAGAAGGGPGRLLRSPQRAATALYQE